MDKVQARYKLLERITKNNVCIGYTVMSFDGHKETVDANRVTECAKNGLIHNVSVRDLNDKSVIYGINGFRISDLPEVKIQNSTKKFILDTLVFSGGTLIGSIIIDTTGKQQKINEQSLMEMIQKHLIVGIDNPNDLGTAKVKRIQLLENVKSSVVESSKTSEVDELLKIYGEQKKEIQKLIKKYNDALTILGLVQDKSVIQITERVNQIEGLIRDGRITKSNLFSYINKLKALVSKLYTQKEAEAKYSMLNNLINTLNGLTESVSHVEGVYKRGLEENIAKVGKEISTLRGINDLYTFISKCKEIKGLEDGINLELNKIYNLQKKDIAEIQERKRFISNEISTSNPDQNILNPYKKELIEKPWYIRYKPLLLHNKYLEACIVVGKNGKSLRLSDIAIHEDRNGYAFEFGKYKYNFSGKLTNLDLITGMMLLADNVGIGHSDVTLRFKSESGKAIQIKV